MLGVAWPSMRVSFDQSLGAAGLIPPFGVAATIASTLTTRHVVARIRIGRLLAVSTGLSAAGLVISAASPRLEIFLVGVVVLGLSGGAIDVALNAYAARHFGPRRINFMHASYVVGAAASPALMTFALQVGASWRWPYALVAIIQLLLTGVFALTASRWKTDGINLSATGSRSSHPRPRRFTVPSSIGIAAVVVQTGIESSAALWAYSFLTLSAGVSAGVAGITISGFWLMMFVSRVLLGSLAEKIGSWATMGVAALGLLVAGGMDSARNDVSDGGTGRRAAVRYRSRPDVSTTHTHRSGSDHTVRDRPARRGTSRCLGRRSGHPSTVVRTRHEHLAERVRADHGGGSCGRRTAAARTAHVAIDHQCVEGPRNKANAAAARSTRPRP